MSEPVVSKYDTKENLFLKFWIPSLDTGINMFELLLLKHDRTYLNGIQKKVGAGHEV